MEKQIPLTQGQIATVDKNVYEEVSKYKWFAQKIKGTYYAARHGKQVDKKPGKYIYMHRFIWVLVNGEMKDGTKIDHIDGNGLNNTANNLRPATHPQNLWNATKKADATSQYKGISWCKTHNKWKIEIQTKGKRKSLGYRKDEKEAALLYDQAAIYYHGEYAKLNFPNHIHTKKYTPKKKSSKYRGVSFNNRAGKYIANIRINYRLKRLGTFEDELDAAKSYDKAAIKYLGDKAKTNFSASNYLIITNNNF